jgi:hypothetical protein
MVTNYPQQLTATTRVSAGERNTRKTADVQAGPASVVARAMGRLGQLLCGVRGHDEVLHYEGNRVMMRCSSCGHDSPGWEISGHGPRRRFEGDARRHSLSPARRHLVLRKSA